jgi:hypothetical protein
VFLGLAAAVVASTGGWRSGSLLIDGPGVSMWLRLLVRYWDAGHGIPSWIPDMWGGVPMWELVSSFHLAIFLPLAKLLGPDAAVKTAMVGAQVAGAWGAFVLARSIWSQTWPSAVAGLIYGLHPFFASHGPMSGFLPSVWVFAATPWLVWSLQKAVRRHGSRYVAVAGLLVGFVLIEQAEHAYSIALLCGTLLIAEVARARRGSGPKGVPGVLFRVGAVLAIGIGVAAHWLFPFLTVGSKSFVLMPLEDVRAGLKIFGGGLADNPGAFLSRGASLSGNMDFERLFGSEFELRGAFASGFYLSWICVALTMATIVWLARSSDRDDGTLSAVLLASALGIWLTLGSVPLADGGLADRDRVLGLAAIGAVSGLVIGTFLRRLDLGRRTGVIAAGMAVSLFALPYIAPLSALQRVIPLLEHLRFPRFYPIAGLGLALGAAYPILLVQRWAAGRNPKLAPLFTAAVCLAVAGAFLVDVHPYRSYYRLEPPESETAYRQASSRLAAFPQHMRVATPYFGDPSSVANFLRNGIDTSVGWPQPQASPNMWRLTGEILAVGPPGFRNRALGLSATAFVAADQLSKLGGATRRVTEVNLEPNPAALPIVRAYEQVLVVPDSEMIPELATALATRYVGVVKGGPDLAKVIGPGAHAVTADGPCLQQEPGDEPWIAAEVAMACSMHMWVGARENLGEIPLGDGVGAVFTSPIADLRGISVWLDGGDRRTELVLRELESDNTFGKEVVRARAAGIDDNGMSLFPFDTPFESAGRRYVYLLTCDGCNGEDEPQMLTSGGPRGPRNLVVGNRLDGERSAAFSLWYDRRPAAAPPSVALRASRPGPGRWEIEVSGANPSLVVVAESWFPGWKATVDGKDVEVVEADGAFLGIPVGAGDHEVKLKYHRPAAATPGRVVTGLTLAASLALIVAPGQPGRRRRRRTRRSGVPTRPAPAGEHPRERQAGQPG